MSPVIKLATMCNWPSNRNPNL